MTFTITKGTIDPVAGDFFQWTAYYQGRIAALRMDLDTLYALAVDDVEVTGVFKGTALLVADTDYTVYTGAYRGRRLTWLSLTATTDERISWCGFGSKWDGLRTGWAHEHARQIAWRWAKPSHAPDWMSVIKPRSYFNLFRWCMGNLYATRLIVSSPQTVQEALEKLLLGISSWTRDDQGRIRFLPYELHAAADRLISIPASALETPSEWQLQPSAAICNYVRCHYDGFSGSGTGGGGTDYIDAEDSRSVRAYGKRGAQIDQRYQLANDAIYTQAGARNLVRSYLRRHAAERTPVKITLPLCEWHWLELGDWDIDITDPDLPNRETRTHGVVRLPVTITDLQHDIDSDIITAIGETVPRESVGVGT